MTRTWERQDAARLIGTNARRLMGWAEKGVLTPAVEGTGKGTRRGYVLEDVITGVVLLALDGAGLGSTVTRGTLAVIEAQLGRIVDQLKTGEIKSAAENLLFILTGARDGVPFVVYGGADEWGRWVTEGASKGLTITAVPLERPLTELLKRIQEAEAA